MFGSSKSDFYSLTKILKLGCQYNMIFGERSNGKTFACLEYAIMNFAKSGKQTAYIRRYREDFVGKRGEQLCASHGDIVKEVTNGEYDGVSYYAKKWYFSKFDPDLGKSVRSETPFMFGFALSEMEHDKSTSYPDVTTVVFDEFMTRGAYLRDEFVCFMNVLSTIIRHRDDVTIFMLGNTVNKYCPYFVDMGLGHIADMEPGKIDVYTYGSSQLKVAVERCANNKKKKKASDMYFAFDNPALEMITGGAWEIDIYPHLPERYKQSQVCYRYFIEFNDQILQCEIVDGDNGVFTYIHNKSTRLKDNPEDLIYSEEYSVKPNHRRNITKPMLPIEHKIWSMFKADKVFYQDNEVGELVRNYLMVCKSL